jgi:hypothetical protein
LFCLYYILYNIKIYHIFTYLYKRRENVSQLNLSTSPGFLFAALYYIICDLRVCSRIEILYQSAHQMNYAHHMMRLLFILTDNYSSLIYIYDVSDVFHFIIYIPSLYYTANPTNQNVYLTIIVVYILLLNGS